jgi:hypothetical protein
MKLIRAIEGLVQFFWHENTRPSSSQKYVINKEGVLGIMNPTLNTFLTLHRQNCRRYLGMSIVHLTWAKYLSRNASLGML